MNYIALNLGPIVLATTVGLVVAAGYAALARRSSRGLLHAGVATALLAVVGHAWLCCILAGALILAPPQAGAWTMALGSAVVIWIGFVLPTVAVNLRWRGVRWLPALGDAGAWLAVMLAQAVVLHLVGLHRPG